MDGARLHYMHGPGTPWISGGSEDVINGFLTYREALTFRLRLTMLAGRPDLPVHSEHRSSKMDLLDVEGHDLVGPAVRIPLLMSDIIYDSVPACLQHLGSYVMAIAPRGPTLRSGEGVESGIKQVWFICFTGTKDALAKFLSRLSSAGALRWDTEVLGQNWRLLHTGRSQVASCWPRMSMAHATSHGRRIGLPACVAVKTFLRSAVELAKEVKILAKCNHHPAINSFMGLFCVEDPAKIHSGSQARCWAMATELECGNDLQRHVEAKRMLEEGSVIKAMLGVTGAVAFLHKLKIIHRDVKPSHILLNYEGCGILSDLSSAVELCGELEKVGELCGSPGYAAPEMVKGLAYDEMVDIYSIGVVIYFALCGTLPFSATAGAVKHNANFSAPALERVSNGLRLLLRAAMAQNRINRPSARASFVTLWHMATPEQRSPVTQSAQMLND